MTFIASRLQNFRAQNPDIDRWQYRDSNYGAWETFRAQSNDPAGIVNQDLRNKAIQAAGGTDIEIPVIDYKAATIQNVTQPLVVAADPLTSALMAISFVDYYFGFKINRAQFQNNELRMRQEFNTQMRRYTLALQDDLDAACITLLETSKTQVANDLLGGRYTFAANTYQAPLAERDALIGDLKPLGRGNDFNGGWDIIGNPSLESHVRNNLQEFGMNNERDKTYQWAEHTWRFTNNVTNAASQLYTGFALQKGTVGALFQYLPDHLLNHSSHNHSWTIQPIPGLDFNMGVYAYDGAVDGSGLNASTAHLTATLEEAFGFHVRVALYTNYISDRATIPSPQYKFQCANA